MFAVGHIAYSVMSETVACLSISVISVNAHKCDWLITFFYFNYKTDVYNKILINMGLR